MSKEQDLIRLKSLSTPAPYVSVRNVGKLKASPNELILNSELNNYIILGGAPQNTPEITKALYNSTITLVAGVGTAIKNKPPKGDNLQLSNKFYYDSAVIQISEQTDVDSNFGSKNTSDLFAKNSSAIAMKADEIRLFSRGSVKIVTGIDQMEKDQVSKNDPDAPTHLKRDFSGISLVANNAVETDEELHPLVLGRNLEEFLNKVLDEINGLYSTIYLLFDYQMKINEAVKNHTHLCNFTLLPLSPNTDAVLLSVINNKNEDIAKLSKMDVESYKTVNIENLRKNYLVKNPGKYINSYYNKTN